MDSIQPAGVVGIGAASGATLGIGMSAAMRIVERNDAGRVSSPAFLPKRLLPLAPIAIGVAGAAAGSLAFIHDPDTRAGAAILGGVPLAGAVVGSAVPLVKIARWEAVVLGGYHSSTKE